MIQRCTYAYTLAKKWKNIIDVKPTNHSLSTVFDVSSMYLSGDQLNGFIEKYIKQIATEKYIKQIARQLRKEHGILKNDECYMCNC